MALGLPVDEREGTIHEYPRRASTRRLHTAIFAVVAIAAGGAAFVCDGGSKPPPRSPAEALHRADARVKFGTLIQLNREGVRSTVVGSLPRDAADLPARTIG